jgi:hypothetical protein
VRRALILVLSVLLVVPACSDPDDRRQAAASATPRPRPLPPIARSSSDVDPVFHVGQQIFITDDGFRPKQLIAIVGEEISWINETKEPKSVRFVNGTFESGPIRSQGSADYTPDGAVSIVYELVDDSEVRASIQVEPYFDPGEDPEAEDRRDADAPTASGSQD